MDGKLIFPGKASKRSDEWYNKEGEYFRTIDTYYLKAKAGKQWFTFVTQRQWMRGNVLRDHFLFSLNVHYKMLFSNIVS